jgi:hypothetical protein
LTSDPRRLNGEFCEFFGMIESPRAESCRDHERGAERSCPSYPILLSSRSSDIKDGSLGKYGERARKWFRRACLAAFKSITTCESLLSWALVFFSIGNVTLGGRDGD